jgi:5-formyltetrahydrofolate cyclo-ligase
MTKIELRKKYKTLRKTISQEGIETQSLTIANSLLKLPIWDKTYYHLFLSITEHKEIQTEFILHILHAKDKEVVISKSNFETQELTNYLLTDNTVIKKNTWGIPEPVDGIEVYDSKIDVVFVPLLAFNKKGHRVGYGKGFYDKFLSNCKPDTLKIGLSFYEAEDIIDGIIESDVALNYCVTPNTIYTF